MTERRPDPSGLVGAAAVVVGLLGCVLWVQMLIGPWNLADGLRDASDHLRRAENALSKGKLKEARYETLAGRAAARRAREGLDSDSPLFDLALASKRLRDALGETPHLVNAAGLSSRAAVGTLDVAQNALRGPDKIISKVDPEDPESDSLIRLDRVEEIAGTIADVRGAIRGVRRELEAVEVDKLPRRFRSTIGDGIDKARQTDDLLAQAEAGFEVLPGFLGKEGPRNYLIGMQNSAELRGTGGAMLEFALLQIDNGRPKLLKSASVYDIDRARRILEIPLPEDAWYQQGIPDSRRFGNANWSPDWPFSARLTIRYAEASATEVPHIDGVIAVDPVVMQKLMSGVGRFRSDKFGVYVTGKTVLNYLLYRTYAAKPVPRIRKARLRDVVDDFYRHMLKPDHPSELVQGLGEALATKHMQIWLADPLEQRFVQAMNWDGGLRKANGSDYLGVVQQNVGGNKLDYHAAMSTEMRVRPEGDDAVVSTGVTISNNVFLPQPRWALGNSGPQHRPMVNVYVPQDAELTAAVLDPPGYKVDAAAEGTSAWSGSQPAEHFELGKRVWSVTLGDPSLSPPGLPAGASATVRYDYRVPGVVRTSEGRSVYRLVLQHQPKARPETVAIRFELPDGARRVEAPGLDVRRSNGRAEAVWEGPLIEDLILEVSWES